MKGRVQDPKGLWMNKLQVISVVNTCDMKGTYLYTWNFTEECSQPVGCLGQESAFAAWTLIPLFCSSCNLPATLVWTQATTKISSANYAWMSGKVSTSSSFGELLVGCKRRGSLFLDIQKIPRGSPPTLLRLQQSVPQRPKLYQVVQGWKRFSLALDCWISKL